MKKAFLLSVGLGFGLLAAAPADAADKVTWNFALYGPPRAVTVTFEHLAKVAKEKSGGNFVINLKYNEQLSEAKDMLDGLKVDAFQGAFVAYSYAPAKTPLQGVLDMPFLPIPDLVSQEKVQDGYQAIFAYPHLVLAPALAVAVTMMAFNFLGDGLRDALDPRTRRL